MKALASILFFQALIFADDAYMGTNGGNIFPQKATRIEMARESVSIDLEKGGGSVKCKFWFVNRGASDTVYVGFPDVQINVAGYTETAKDFKTWVNGRSVEVKRDSILDTSDPTDSSKNSWYVWKAFFPKDDTTVIENRYFGLWGGSYCEKSFAYIIGTGNSWNGPIGKGRVVFNYGNLLSSLFVGKGVWKDKDDLLPEYYEDSAVYEFSHYAPKDGERLDVWFSSYWGNVDSTSCPGFYIPIDSLGNKDEIVDELFARQGHIFKSKSIQKKYAAKRWYKPRRPLKLAELPQDIQNYIVRLKSGKNRLVGEK
jgi:hypothetical protein